jgi:RNA-binding protein YlmH
MEKHELLKRGEDLARRCEQKNLLTHTGFLSPAERFALEHDPALRLSRMSFFGGFPDAERTMAFFLPEYLEAEDPSVSENVRCIRLTAAFGEPGHRDYMGAILGMGVGREWVGDILVDGQRVYIVCQPSVLRHLLSIEKVGRWGVKAEEVPLEEIPRRERQTQERRFTVSSPRLDAVCAGMFRLSRSEAARQIEAGAVGLNYEECLKSDAQLREGDVVSLRGAGKARLAEIGGSSRKGRLFVSVDLYR